MVEVVCPECGQHVRDVPEETVGQQVRCKKCNERFVAMPYFEETFRKNGGSRDGAEAERSFFTPAAVESDRSSLPRDPGNSEHNGYVDVLRFIGVMLMCLPALLSVILFLQISWPVPLTILLGGLVSGGTLLCFAEIIRLLHAIMLQAKRRNEESRPVNP